MDEEKIFEMANLKTIHSWSELLNVDVSLLPCQVSLPKKNADENQDQQQQQQSADEVDSILKENIAELKAQYKENMKGMHILKKNILLLFLNYD